jgi:hypothetical protein
VPFGSGFGVHAPLSRWHAGWRRLRAGPNFAGWCPHPTGESRAACSPARTWAAISGGWHRPARAGPCVDDPGTPGRLTLRQTPSPHPQGGPPQARFHPHPDCRPALAGHKGQGFVRWLAWPIRPSGRPIEGLPLRLILLPAEPAGAPPPPSSRRTLRQAPGGLPPAWTDTFPVHPVTGAHGVMARGLGAGKRLSGILAIQLESLGREPGSVNAKTAFSQNPISPLAGEMSAKQTEGGMVQPVSKARNLGKAHPPLSPTVTSPPQGGRLGVVQTG